MTRLCASDGCKNPPEELFRHCSACIHAFMNPLTENQQAAVKRRQDAIAGGKCGICGNHDAMPGRRVCERCQGLRTPPKKRAYQKRRREQLARQKLCINGKKHGKATHGVRCVRCHETHQGSTS